MSQGRHRRPAFRTAALSLIGLLPMLQVLLSAESVAAESYSYGFVRTKGYVVAQTVPLPSWHARLQVLRDVRIASRTAREMWGERWDPVEYFGGWTTAIGREFMDRPVLPARLRLLDRDGHILDEFVDFNVPLARIEKQRLGEALLVTADASESFGALSGQFTVAYQIRFPKIERVRAIDGDGKEWSIWLLSAATADWRIVSGTVSPEALAVVCAPGYAGTKQEGFYTHWTTYKIVDGVWRTAEREERGCWDYDRPFPERWKFPK